jgi:hypothetical protein
MEHKTHTTLSEQSQSQIQRDKIDTPNTQIQNRSLSWSKNKLNFIYLRESSSHRLSVQSNMCIRVFGRCFSQLYSMLIQIKWVYMYHFEY